MPRVPHSASRLTPVSLSDTNSFSSLDPLDIGPISASAGSFQGPPAMESEVLNVLLEHVMVCPVSTVSHIPRSVRRLLAHVLSMELRRACSSTWCFVRLLMFADAMFLVPFFLTVCTFGLSLMGLELYGHPCGMISRTLNIATVLPAMISIKLVLCIGHVRVGIVTLFKLLPLLELQDMMIMMMMPIRICLSATLLLYALTVMITHLLHLLQWMILWFCWQFPKGTSPGASKLHSQCLLDAVSGSTAPAAGECLRSLTFFVNHLLSGKSPSCLAPWLFDAPLTALLKKGGGVRPIAVGEPSS